MKTIASLSIPQMFTAYAEDQEYLKSGLHHIQYFCEKCDQPFAAAWGRLENAMSYYERGKYFTCPHCGTRHGEHVQYAKRHERIPNSVYLAVKEFKNAVTFEVQCTITYFDGYLNLREGGRKEVFKFDIHNQKVTFTTYASYAGRSPKEEVIELGNPLGLDVLSKSILRYFVNTSLPIYKNRSKLVQLLKSLRETVHSRLEKHLGHKISSMHVSSGQIHGLFLLPIFNIAYRVTFPDAPNLPKVYRERLETIQNTMNRRMVDKKKMVQLMAVNHVNKNLMQSLLQVNHLPDKPLIRKALNDDPLNFGLLSKAFSLCSNYDYANRMYMSFKAIGEDVRLRWSLSKDLCRFLRAMKLFYGELGIVRLVENYEDMQLYDCVGLYKQLSRENKRAIKTESVRLRDLHDWMSLRHKKQNHKNINFNVPDHIIKRLSMQREQLKFFLPKESMQLLEAGHELHNCVASYGASMKDHKKWIVLVADDKGKLAVCMELVGGELVQAKIDRNKPVASDKTLNAAVVAWANERNIKINTRDVSVTSNEKTGITIPA